MPETDFVLSTGEDGLRFTTFRDMLMKNNRENADELTSWHDVQGSWG